MNKIRINFFGTHYFATTILQTLIDCPDITIEIVFTMPDRPIGRKQKLQPSPIKLLAKKNNLKIEQPDNFKSYVLKHKTDLNIVVDYGMIIPQNIINTPKYGTINIHPSLLPKYRGPSPIQSVLLNGETKTGVSIMLIDTKMDHGPILAQKTINIDKTDIYPTLSKKLALEASNMFISTIKSYLAGKIIPQTQDHTQATFCKMLTRKNGLIDFSKTAQTIYNQYRGLTPWPGIYTELKVYKIHKIIKSKPSNNLRLKLLNLKICDRNIEPGKIVYENNQIFIGCKNGAIEVLELQLEGKQAMNAKNFINGNQSLNGVIL